jgi:hypothetical protein
MTATIETQIWMAVKARIQTLSLSPAVPVVYPKQDVPVSRHIRVSWIPNQNVRRAIGSTDAHTRPSILQLSLYSPVSLQDAPEVDTQIAGSIAAHFLPDLRMEFNDASVRVTAAPFVGSSFRDNEWWQTPVSVFVVSYI